MEAVKEVHWGTALAIALALLLVVQPAVFAIAGGHIANDPERQETFRTRIAPNLEGTLSPTTVGGREVFVEHLAGTKATQHLAALKKRKKEAFKKAEEDLQTFGMQETGHVYVVRTFDLESLSPASSSITTSTGEIVFSSWDDGYDGTWEGVIYAENYNGGSVTYNAQINIEQNGNNWTVWRTVVDYDPYGGGNGDREALLDDSQTQLRLDAVFAGLTQTYSEAIPAIGGSSQLRPMLAGAYDYYRCAFWGCLGAAVGCFFLGPAAPPCFFVACTAVLVGCLGELAK